jgi:hypothetical protein
MNSELGDTRLETEHDELDASGDEEMIETVVLPETDATDNVGDASVEINVEQLIADIEKTGEDVSEHQMEVRRRLEEIAEEKSLDDTFAIDFDEET